MENTDTINILINLENQLKEKMLERGREISENGQHDNAVTNPLDTEIYILKNRIVKFQK